MENENRILENRAEFFPEFDDIRKAVLEAREKVATTVNAAMVAAYWTVGKRLYDVQVSTGSIYGKKLIKYTSKQLQEEFGKGFDERNLRNMRQFYEAFPKWNTVCSELSWSHYRLLMRIEDQEKRAYYVKECVECAWSVRQLERQINSFYYERILSTNENEKAQVKDEIWKLEPDKNPKYLLKDPYILEFLELQENRAYLEHELEQGLIDNLQKFLLELGKGFCFVARQKRITIEGDHYYVDLVFYNYILKCFVLIDLKTHKLTYQDIGQIDFYVKYFEENVKTEGDNPTIGIVLCSEKNETMVKYSILNENEHLFASKYKLYIPSEEELKKEIERERFNIEQRLEDAKEE
ncbi:MAG: PDDEXK nuclease domain-containing protein [Clostridium sp.]|nr:PDDEXK nuclease domain-containing protein [Clostridium sp.]